MMPISDHRFQTLRLLEALLFSATEPLSETALAGHLPNGTDVARLLEELATTYADRGVQLVRRDGSWAFRTASDLMPRLKVETKIQRKLSRAAIETLAIIAYHQPVTRGEVEEIRGVALSKGTLDTLLEIGWIRPKGRRRTPGRPVAWATTGAFYDHFGLEGRDALPGIDELRAAGLLESGTAIASLGARAMSSIPQSLANTETDADEDPLDEESLVGEFRDLPEET